MYAHMIHLVRAGGCCLVMSLSACSDGSSESPESPESQDDNTWYSNGYVMETVLTYNGAGLLNDTQRCDWHSAERQLRCLSSDTADTETWQHDTQGRLLTLSNSSEQEPDQLWLDNEYRDGSLIRSSAPYWELYAQSSADAETLAEAATSDSTMAAEENMAVVTKLSWGGEGIESYEQFDGAYPTATDAEFTELKIEWSEGRLRSVEPISTPTEMSDINTRHSYDYNAKHQLQTKSSFDWINTSQSWQLSGQESYQYDEHGNLSVWSYFSDLGQLEVRQVISWQQTDSVVENFSLMGGRVP